MAAKGHQRRDVRRGDGYITERATSTGEMRYQARWQDVGAWRSKTFGTRDEAEDHLRTVGRLRRSGRYVAESQLTVNEAVAAYLERGKKRWKTNTYATYSATHRIHIKPHLGKLRIVTITPLRVQHWVDTLAAKNLSAAVIENARVVLNGACKDAVRLGVIPSNPVTGAYLPARERHTYQVWSADNVRAVMHECSGDIRMRTYYAVALTTAMRPGEIRALKWSDINLDKGRLTVARTITRDERGRQVMGTTTKTGRSRTIALPASTVGALKSLRIWQAERRLAARRWGKEDLVFDRGDGNILPQKTVDRAHKRISADANVPIIRVHDLRHTAATLLLEAGTHVKVVADLLGHSSVSITLDTYSHPGESIQREATNVLGDILERHA